MSSPSIVFSVIKHDQTQRRMGMFHCEVLLIIVFRPAMFVEQDKIFTHYKLFVESWRMQHVLLYGSY